MFHVPGRLFFQPGSTAITCSRSSTQLYWCDWGRTGCCWTPAEKPFFLCNGLSTMRSVRVQYHYLLFSVFLPAAVPYVETSCASAKTRNSSVSFRLGGGGSSVVVSETSQQVMDTFELMRSAYFTRGSNSLPDLNEPVPRIEVNFYMWLACRKQQWRKHRTDKRARRQLTPEEDFPR